MLTRLSFFDETVAPSEYEQISRRISATVLTSWAGYGWLKNQAGSTARVASSITRIPCSRHSS